eukprot:scaffold13609_cov106-Isochrysis_galbana.AAC.4
MAGGGGSSGSAQGQARRRAAGWGGGGGMTVCTWCGNPFQMAGISPSCQWEPSCSPGSSTTVELRSPAAKHALSAVSVGGSRIVKLRVCRSNGSPL